MSERKTLLGKIFGPIWDEVKSIFAANYKTFVKNIVDKQPPEVKEKLGWVYDLVNNIKSYVDNPAVDFLTSVIPGTLDDAIVKELRSILATVIEEMKIIDTPSSELTKTDLQGLATSLTEKITGLPFGQSGVSIQAYYDNKTLNG
jgi:hypothetical protein